MLLCSAKHFEVLTIIARGFIRGYKVPEGRLKNKYLITSSGCTCQF